MRMKPLRLFVLIVKVSLAFQSQTVRRRPGKWIRAPVSSLFAESKADARSNLKTTRSTPSSITTTPTKNAERFHRIQRSTTLVGACTATWLLAQRVSVVQASSIVGLLGCATRSPAMAAAVFCGSFAGMTAHAPGLLEATTVGSLVAAVYYMWDANKVGVGKGGRLGTIAFLGSLLYHASSSSSSLAQGLPVVQQTLKILGRQNVIAMTLSWTVLHFSRKSNTERTTTLLKYLAKAGVLASVASSAWGVVPFKELALTSLSVYVASLAVKESDGIVLPVAALGLLGSFTPYAAPIYLGAFLGMTGLVTFGTAHFAQASIFSALLLKLGLWNGFGGKLGMQAFLGVLFGM